MNKLGIIVSVLVFCFSLGCSSNPQFNTKHETHHITVITEPAGAKVIQGHPVGQPSTLLGTSPVVDQPVVIISQVSMKNVNYTLMNDLKRRVGHVMVTISKEGYETYRGALKTTSEKTAEHKITLVPKSEK